MAILSSKQKLLSVILGSALCSSVAYSALYGGGPAETWTQAQITALTSKISGDITLFGSTFSAHMQAKFEQVISAVAIATKQESLSASVVSDSSMQAANQIINAATTQNMNDQVTQAYLNYNGATGQGYDPCGTLVRNKTLDQAFSGMGGTVATKMAKMDVAGGKLVPSRAEALKTRLAQHRDKFCSVGEAEAGLCTLSDLPAGDTNAALLFESTAEGSLVSEARQSYIQHVMGEPDEALTTAAGRSATGQAYLLNKTRKDALLSIPTYSLQTISAANTQSAEYKNMSPNELLQSRVNQYFGGEEAEKWAGTLTHQAPRGLLVEAAKMAGLQVWIRQKSYEQNQRIIANLSALQIASAEPLKNIVEQHAVALQRNTVNQQIK